MCPCTAFRVAIAHRQLNDCPLPTRNYVVYAVLDFLTCRVTVCCVWLSHRLSSWVVYVKLHLLAQLLATWYSTTVLTTTSMCTWLFNCLVQFVIVSLFCKTRILNDSSLPQVIHLYKRPVFPNFPTVLLQACLPMRTINSVCMETSSV